MASHEERSDRDTQLAAQDLAIHVEWLRRLARSLLRAGDECTDLVQETLLEALRTPLRAGPGVRAWLRQVLLRRAARERLKRAARERREQAAARGEAQPSAEDIVARLAATRALTEAVLALPEAQRRVVWLRYFEELPPRAIARQLGVPVETVRTRTKRALAALRSALEARGGGEWRTALAPFAGVSMSALGGGAVGTTTALGAVGIGGLAMKGKLAIVAALIVGAMFLVAGWDPAGWLAPAEALDVPREALVAEANAEPRETRVERAEETSPAPEVAAFSTASAPRRRGIAIFGRCVSATGAPVAEVAFELRALAAYEVDRPRALGTTSAVSGSDGRFSLELETSEVAGVQVRMRPEGAAAQQWLWRALEEGASHDLGDVVLREAGALLVRIVDAEGRLLLEPWRVSAEITAPEANASFGVKGFAVPFGGLQAQSERVPAQEGVHRLRDLPPGSCTLRAHLGVLRTEALAVVVRAGEEQELVLRHTGPRPESLLVVKFLGRSRSPALEHVHLEGLGIERRFPAKPYRFEDLPPGPFTLRVDDPRYEALVREGLQPGPEPVELLLRANSAVRLRVVAGAERAPVASFGLRSDQREYSVEIEPVAPREGGRLELDDLAAGDHRYRLLAPGFAPTVMEILGLQPQERREVEVILEKSASCRGIVTCGEPVRGVAQAFLELRSATGERRGMQWTDDQGRFAFEGLATGSYVLAAQYGGAVKSELEIELVAGTAREDLALHLPHAAFVSVALRGPAGAPPGDVKLLVATRDAEGQWNFERSTVLGEDGRAVLGPFAPGPHRLSWGFGLHLHPWLPLEELELRDGETATIERELSEGWPGRLEVELACGGDPGAELEVQARRTDEHQGRFSEQTDSAGRAVFERVWSGELELVVRDAFRLCEYVVPEKVKVAAGATTSVRCEVPLRRFAVQCVDAESGAPLARQALAFFRAEEAELSPIELRTDPDGRIAFHMVPGGRYRIVDYRAARRAALDAGVVDWRRLVEPLQKVEVVELRAGAEPLVLKVARF
ncbi:MAG: sigma-70 family RNA polymerase sigma factor [Planctomycetes bacterium]|nr:sigma-70 family RNA polymerase sigma factor [Planctomycetota bacterium]